MAATSADVVSTADLRDATGVIGDAEDGQLETLRDAAVGWIEDYAHRTIVDRSVTTSSMDFWYPDWTDAWVFRIPDAKSTGSIEVRYAATDADPSGTGGETETISLPDARVKVEDDWVRVFPPTDRYWHQLARMGDPMPTLTATCGIEADAIPKEFGIAVRLLVRALYEGTAFDQMPEMNTLQLVMARYHTRRFRNPPMA